MDEIEETPDERRRRLKREANARYRSKQENRKKDRSACARWRASERGKQWMSEKEKQARARYRATEKGKAAVKRGRYRYRATPKGKEVERRSQARRYSTVKGKTYYREYQSRRYATDPIYRLSMQTRNRIRAVLRAALAEKSAPSLDLLGCSPKQFKEYLEALWEDGMGWDNYGKWEVDHVKPVAAFDLNNPVEQALAFHFSNTRPMWRSENRSKGSLFEGKRVRHR